MDYSSARSQSRRCRQVGTWGCLLSVALLYSTPAQAQIDRPGQHVRYSTEVEPHLVVQWDEEPWWEDEGLGVGLHVSIPLVDNGPVTTINHNLAITFGLDWAHFDDACVPFNNPNFGGDCSANDFWLPIAAQWNFFFSDLISAMMELGLGIQHSRWEGPTLCSGQICQYDDDDTDVELVLWIGMRLHLSQDVALSLRIGTPSLLLGVAFFL
jgi:hypothetical protein